jgi:uncharacterized protein (TIGR02246 family)
VDDSPDSSAIRALIQTYESAVNRRDVEAAIATYTPDADSWIVGYDRVVGIEAIRRKEEQVARLAGFQSWTASIDAIRFIGADVAVVESSGTVVIGGGSIAERVTWVVHRTAVGWRIAALRVMEFKRAGP